MPRVQRFFQLTILILSGGILLANLFVVDSALAVQLNCDLRIISLLSCPSGSVSETSSGIVSAAGTVDAEKEKADNGIDMTDSTSGNNHFISEDTEDKSDNKNNNLDANIESQYLQ